MVLHVIMLVTGLLFIIRFRFRKPNKQGDRTADRDRGSCSCVHTAVFPLERLRAVELEACVEYDYEKEVMRSNGI